MQERRMLKPNQYDILKGIGKKLKLYEEKVYKLSPNIADDFVDEKFERVAKRVTLPLTQDKTYKTQFFNEMLAFAVQPLNKDTEIILYNKNGAVANPYPYFPKLVEEYASIVCQVEPDEPFTEVSVVIYCGPEIGDILLSDGSVTMDSEYKPTKKTDIATKDYIDKLFENFTALAYPLRTFSIEQQNGFAPITANCYLDNSPYKDVLFIRNATTKARMPDCFLTVDPFALSSTFTENTQIAICVEGLTTHAAKLADIIKGENSYWSLMSSENIYTVTGAVDKIYWRNSYRLRFNLESFASHCSAEKPYLDISLRVWDENGSSKYSDTYTFGIDEYVDSAIADGSISFIEENLSKYKTKWISGERYFDDDYDAVYSLPITVNVQNNFLNYFRSQNFNLKLFVVNEEGEVAYEYDLPIASHQPLKNSFTFEQKIDFSIKNNIIRVQAFNVKDEFLFEFDEVLDTASDYSDESNRVTTPSASEEYPTINYGEPWDSSAAIKPWDMKLQKGIYTSNKNDSAVCFVVKPNDCYSHINIDIEHDGRMFVLSEGNTNWLSCAKQSDAFVAPTKNNEGCKVNETYYTFGKVTYTSKVFIRILEATRVKFNSAALG